MSALPENSELADTPVFHPCPQDPSCPYCNGSIQATGEALDWSFLDGAYCISLKSREDRAASAAAQFHKVGLCQQVTFYRPTKHPENGIIGSWESHRAVGMHALQRGCENALIFEDDVELARRLRPKTVNRVRRALDQLPPDWMIFFIGHWPLWAYFVRPYILRTGSACCHAYIVSPRLMQWLQDHPYGTPGIEKSQLVGKGIDSAYSQLPATYALFPMIAGQIVSESDNFSYKPDKKRKLKHLITRSGHRELLISKLMHPNEILMAILSPVFWAVHSARRLRR